MTLHFAYGSNMSRALMESRCRDARALGVATLPGWRFVINREGYGSIAPRAGGLVYGVLWRLSVRDLAAINAYESVSTDFYLRHRLAVRLAHVPAKARPGLDPGWTPVRRQEHAPLNDSRACPDSEG